MLCFDIRHLDRDPMNQLHLGKGSHKPPPFHYKLKRLFNRLVFDARTYLESGFSRLNNCLPGCLLLAFHFKMGQPTIRKLTITQITNELRHINYKPFLTVGANGIPMNRLRSFERTLSPIPFGLVRIWPLLSSFQGVAINVFTIRRNGESFRIFPFSLSEHSRSQSHFQLDVLLDTADIRQHSETPPNNHCLLIANLALLLSRFGEKQQNSNKYVHVCRSCGRTYVSYQLLKNHFQCCTHLQRNSIGRRKSHNQLLHRPYIKNKYSGKHERNGLTWKTSFHHMLLKPSGLVILDFECLNVKKNNSQDSENKSFIRASNNVYEKVPNATVMTQQVISFAYIHKSLYPQFPMSEKLSQPRFKFYNEDDEHPLRSFYISLLLSLRNDLLLYEERVKNILAIDSPPPPPGQRSLDLLVHIANTELCELCGKKFGSKVMSPLTRKFYILKRTFDHNHISATGFPTNSTQLRSVLCQASDLQYSCSSLLFSYLFLYWFSERSQRFFLKKKEKPISGLKSSSRSVDIDIDF